MKGIPRRRFSEKMRHRKTPKLPQTGVMFHLIVNFRVDMREGDQSNQITN